MARASIRAIRERSRDPAHPVEAVMSGLRLLTLRECAERLGIGAARVRVFVAEGRLSAHRAGPIWLVTESELERFAKLPRRPGPRHATRTAD